jgi:Flp pilus assembly protein TadD
MQGNLEQAVSALEPAQRDHPDNIEVLTQTGIIAGRQGRFAEAIAAFQQAVALNPDERSLTEALAEAQWRAGQHEAAITTMTGWLEHRPQDHEMHLTLANLYLALNRHDEAITNFQQVLEYAPDHVVALNNLAWLLRAEDAEQALSFAERAVELAPQSAPIYDTLGVIQLEMGQPVQALATLREAVKFSDNAPSIRLNLAKALLANAEHAEAEAELRSLLDEYPQFSEREEALRLLGE